MIRTQSEMKKEIRNSMRGGKGEVEILHLLNEGEFHGKGRLFAKLTIKPGMSIGLHQHVGDFETFYIIKGEGKVYDNGVEKTIRQGDVMYTDNSEEHSIENTGSEDLEFIALVLYA